MRKITSVVVGAFLNRQPKRLSNTDTDGNALFVFWNKIAEYRGADLWITSAGYRSNLTKERLNGIPGVRIHQRNFKWYLGQEEWDGSWIKV